MSIGWAAFLQDILERIHKYARRKPEQRPE